MNTKPVREFFVGYLIMPKKLKVLFRAVVAILLVAGVGFGFALSSAQKSVGQGNWQATATQTVAGRLSLDPYPILHTAGQAPRSILLVHTGKISAAEFVSPFVGKLVVVSGAPIDRGGWSMLELRSTDDIVERAGLADAVSPTSDPLLPISLTGEIVDSKCFLGVMKPGAGKVHRACAATCLTGGIPPMLVVTDQHGDRYGYMLINDDGSSAAQRVVPDVGVPVRVHGQLERRGELTYLRIAPQGISRITERI